MKQNAVQTLLNDPEWSAWSNVEIGDRCSVGRHYQSLAVSGFTDQARHQRRHELGGWAQRDVPQGEGK
jgi:hypothetical protein